MLNLKKKLNKLNFSNSYPKKAPIVIFEDDCGSIQILRDYILKKISKKDTVLGPSYIYVSFLGLYLLLLSIIKVFFSFEKNNFVNIRSEYQCQILKSINAKVIITRIDDSIALSYLINKYKQGRFISIQNGYRSNYTLRNLSNRGIQYDILYTFGEDLPKRWNKLGCKINESYSVGSVLAGVYAESRSKTKIYNIGYASQWKPSANREHLEKLRDICIAIDQIQKFSEKTLEVAVFGRDNDYIKEKEFYDKYLSNYTYVTNKRYTGNFLSIYENIDQTDLLITYYSTVGIEMISFNTKVLFVDFDKSHFLDDLNDGIWVYRGNKDVNFRNYVMRLLKMRYEEWYKLSSNWIEESSSLSFTNLPHHEIIKKINKLLSL